ncbi:hypothetical protein SPSIL_055600 [Sporomusa silvacetica DSM 10669]|uniref:Uncharacterized protein n=1 Tax=Sporomusa silvacetica DSM 10669 TaxID=1123289 RepID=A0ABZ3IVD8_9FIRM|nr:hypothetical protein [Sporomusa silvacetica]OZC16612.1 hypothetical protein SPSIL_36480 [Sporomusa silvacetica DSM 10669]
MFKETDYSIVMLVEILPIHQSGLYADTFVAVHFKIFNIKDKKYLYHGKLWSEKGFASSALEDINIHLDKILTDTFKL